MHGRMTAPKLGEMPLQSRFTGLHAAVMVVFAGFGGEAGSLSGSMPAITRAAGADSPALGISITLAPWIFGMIAGGFGLSAAFGRVAAGLCVALGFVAALRYGRR